MEKNSKTANGNNGKQQGSGSSAGKLKLSLKLPPSQAIQHSNQPSINSKQVASKKITIKLANTSGTTSKAFAQSAGQDAEAVSDFSDVSSSDDEDDAGSNSIHLINQALNNSVIGGFGNDAEDEETVDVDGVDIVSVDQPSSSSQSRNVNGFAPRSAPTVPGSGRRGWGKKRKYLKEVAENLLNSFIKKDSYGFFLNPVDIKYVPDYLTVIKQPMDFGTIRSKIEHNSYRKLQEFKDDLYLVFYNAKTYNAPNTVFYKTAQKIQEYADKSFQRIEDKVTIVEEEEKPVHANVSLDLQTQNEHKGKRKKYKKKTKFGKFISEDGSLDPSSLESMVPLLLPKIGFPFTAACRKSLEQSHDPNYEHSELELLRLYPTFTYVDFCAFRTLQLPVNSNKTLTDENVAELGAKPEPTGPAMLKFAQQVYGEDRTLAYIESLKHFKHGFSDDNPVAKMIERKISQLTYGSDALVDNTLRVLENEEVLPIRSAEYSHLTNGIDVKREVANAKQRRLREIAVKTASNFNQSDFVALNQLLNSASDFKPTSEPVTDVSHGSELLSKANEILKKFIIRPLESGSFNEKEIEEIKQLQRCLQDLAEFCTKSDPSKQTKQQQQSVPPPQVISQNAAAQYAANVQSQRPVVPIAKYPIPPVIQMAQFPINIPGFPFPIQPHNPGKQLTPAEIAALQANILRQNGQMQKQKQTPSTFKPPN